MSHIGAVIDSYNDALAAEQAKNYLTAARHYRLCILFYENGELPCFVQEVKEDAGIAYSGYARCRSKLCTEIQDMLDTEKSKYVSSSYFVWNWQDFVNEEYQRIEAERKNLTSI